MGHVQDSLDNFLDDEEDAPLLGSRLGRRYGEHSETNGTIPKINAIDISDFNKSRWRSIRVMYLSVFLGAITFTITMSSLWPFLQVLDPSVQASFLGWVVSSYSLGQLFASPLFGAWSTYRQSSKEPLTVSLILMVLSNLFYCYLQTIPSHRTLFMILARGLIGFSAGNVAVIRSYISGATTLQERTSAMGNLSMCQAMGFILGPVFQSALVFIKYPGPIESPGLHFNMYTAPAFFAASVAFINLILFLLIFKEYRLNDEDTDDVNANKQIQQEDIEKSMEAVCTSNTHEVKEYKLDMVAVLSSIYLFFVVLFMFTVFETIGTPLTMHMYAWSKSKATFYQGIILGVGGCFSICVFGGTKMLAKKYNERYLLLVGFLLCLTGYFAFIPWGHTLPPRAMAPIKNDSRPTSPEAIFYMVTDLLYEHDNAIGDNSKHNDVSNQQIKFTLPDAMQKQTSAQLRRSDKSNNLLQNKFAVKNSAISINVYKNIIHHPFFQNSYSNSTHIISHLTTNYSTRIPPTQTSKTTPNRTEMTTKLPTEITTTITPTTTSHTTSHTKMTTKSTTEITTTINPTTTGITTTITPTTTSHTTSHSKMTTKSTTEITTTINPTTTKITTTIKPITTTTDIFTTTINATTPAANHSGDNSPEGCPWQYDWCGHVPVIPLFQYLIASFLITLGYPMCNMLTYTIYSKVLGPKPQGLWMGWLTASGSFARTVGPIYVSQIYDSFGPQVTYGSISAYIFITIFFYLFVFRRLVPFTYTSNPRAPLLFWKKRNRNLL